MLPEEKQKLLDYIKTAIDVETDIETQNQTSAEYQTWIAAKEPILIKKEPQKPAYLDESGNDKGVAGFGIGMGILMGIGGFLSMVAMPESLILIIFGLIVVALSIWMIKVGADRIRYIKEHNNNEAIAFWKRTEKIKSENAENEKRYYQNHTEWQKLREEIDKNWKRRISNRWTFVKNSMHGL